MNFQKLINACSDINNTGREKNNIYLECMLKNISNDTEEIIDYSFRSVVNIYIDNYEAQVDLIFPLAGNEDLKNIWYIMNKVIKTPQNSVVDEKEIVPLINLTIVPDKYGGKYSFFGIGAHHLSLTSDDVGKLPNMIRMVFNTKEFGLIDDSDVLEFKTNEEEVEEIEEVKEEEIIEEVKETKEVITEEEVIEENEVDIIVEEEEEDDDFFD